MVHLPNLTFYRKPATDANNTNRPAITGNARCSVYKFWQKFKCEKRASNIALSYGTDVHK